ncbi:hypothetical protein SH668x_002852 [Planctomicrobium sp. SH668]|uniref:hypothetical protein n=1 Tax=Planctomicrobium sp. SH668 TaxID=3448126 RepID=UPI003F5B8034
MMKTTHAIRPSFRVTLLRSISLIAVVLASQFNGTRSYANEVIATERDKCIDEALYQLAVWRDSFSTLDLEFTWNCPPDWTAGTNAIAESGEIRKTRYLWQDWWVSSDHQLSKTITYNEFNQPMKETGRNKDVIYSANYLTYQATPTHVELAKFGGKRGFDTQEQRIMIPVMLITTDWFNSIFDQQRVEAYGIKYINGSKCVGFVVDKTIRPTIWLDLDHGGLPCLVEATSHDSNFRWECTEFTKTDNGLWFPSKGVVKFGLNSTTHFEVTKVVMDQTIAPEQFALPLIDQKTFVRDLANGIQKLEVASPPVLSFQVAEAGLIPWWRFNCSFGMVVASLGWLHWRRKTIRFQTV